MGDSCSGGDNDMDDSALYPASFDLDNIISVAATDNQDNLWSKSNFGQHRVHVAAPGVAVLTTNLQGPLHPTLIEPVLIQEMRSEIPRESESRIFRNHNADETPIALLFE